MKNGPNQSTCPTCGNHFSPRTGVVASVLTGHGTLAPVKVCTHCAARGLLLLAGDSSLSQRAALAPFVAYLRKIAKAYELASRDDKIGTQSMGLAQAADILEAGRLPAQSSASIGDAPATRRAPIRRSVRAMALIGAPNGVAPIGTTVPASSPATAREKPAELGRCERAILQALLERDSLTRTTLAVRTGYAVDSGGFAKALRRLINRGAMLSSNARARGLDVGLAIQTEVGKPLLGGDYASLLPPIGDLVAYWSERVGTCAGTLLQVLAGSERIVSRDELALMADYSPESGGFAKALRKLRRLRLVDADACKVSAELAELMGKEERT